MTIEEIIEVMETMYDNQQCDTCALQQTEDCNGSTPCIFLMIADQLTEESDG